MFNLFKKKKVDKEKLCIRMKTKIEKVSLSFNYLEIIADGYLTGNFEPLFPLLAEDCVLESQWLPEPNVGYDTIVSYLRGKGETLKKSGRFPQCYVHELTKNSFQYSIGDMGLVMEQGFEDETSRSIIFVSLNDDDKISRIDFYNKDFFEYRFCIPRIFLCPCKGDDCIQNGKIHFNYQYAGEIRLFFAVANVHFDYETKRVPMEKWIETLECWKRFYSYNSFDEAFEDACGIDHEHFTLKNMEARAFEIWKKRFINPQMPERLIEWTNKYKDTCDYMDVFGV